MPSQTASSSLSGYTDADRSLIMAHIQKHFGKISGIGQVQLPTGTALELLIITPPSRKHLGKLFAPAGSSAGTEEEILLFSLGAGAHSMNVPKDSELPPRAEYLIRLPSTWNLQSEDEKSAWPVHLLLNIVSLPETEQSYNAWGHTFSFTHGEPFAENTRLCSAVLTGMNDREGQCRLNNNETVTFYEIVPLYAEELTFAEQNGMIALIDEFIRYNIPRQVVLNRPNAALLAMYRSDILQKLHTSDKNTLSQMMQHRETLSQEENIVINDILRSEQSMGKRTIGKMKNILTSFFHR